MFFFLVFGVLIGEGCRSGEFCVAAYLNRESFVKFLVDLYFARGVRSSLRREAVWSGMCYAYMFLCWASW